nr:9340_t:CDS:10 [Entrophospora candida]
MSEEEVKRLLKLVEESLNETSITIKLTKKRITEIPIEVINYAINYNVDRLSIEINQLSKLPKEMSNFTHLRYLNLSQNAFIEFPEALCSMPSLKILDISKNKICKLPQDFGKLMTLQLLKISKNQIKRLPKYIADMKDLQYLKIDFNPIKFPPKSIHVIPKGEDKDVMLPWLENLKEYLRQNSDESDEIKNSSSDEEVDCQFDSQNNNKQLKKATSVDTINYLSSNVSTRQIVDSGGGSSSSLKTIKESDQPIPKQEKRRLNPKLSLDLPFAHRNRSHSNDFDATLAIFRSKFVHKHSKSASSDSISSTQSQSGIAEEKQSDYYFQKLRALLPTENLPMSDISLREASRNILYAFSQVHKAIRQFAIVTGSEKIFMNDLNKAAKLIGQLSTALQIYDDFALQTPDADHCIKLLTTCQENISSFKLLMELLNKQLKSLTQSPENMRYSRTLLLMLHGAVADIKFAWELIFPLLNAQTPYTGMSTPFRSKSMTRSNSSNIANVAPYSASATSSYFSSSSYSLNTPTSAGSGPHSAGLHNNLNTDFLFSIAIFNQLLSQVEVAIKAVENVIKCLSDNVEDVLEPTNEDQMKSSSSIKDKMNELVKDANEVTILLKKSLLSAKSSTNNKDDPSIQLKVYDDTLVFLQTTIKLCEFAKEVSHKWQLNSKVKSGLSHVMKSYTELTVQICNGNDVCSLWEPGYWRNSDLQREHIFHNVKSVNVPLGMIVVLITHSDKRLIMPYGFSDCKERDICSFVARLDISANLRLALDQISKYIENNSTNEIIHFHKAKSHFPKNVITLVSQFSANRLTRFEQAISVWPGPISVVLYLLDPEDVNQLVKYFEMDKNLYLYNRISMTIIKPNYLSDNYLKYPINKLRNIGIKTAPSNYIFVMDADFVPTRNLYHFSMENLIPILESPPNNNNDNNNNRYYQKPTAFVVPCVAIHENYFGKFPNTISELRDLYNKGIAYITDPFAGHGPTGTQILLSHQLYNSNPFYEICYESQWEPYYIISKSSPYYDERFENQGGDKQQHALSLNALGYRFLVLKDHFIYHMDHRKLVWADGGLEKNQKLLKDFTYFDHYIPEMQRIFGNNVRWPRGCSHPFVKEQFRDLMGIGLN